MRVLHESGVVRVRACRRGAMAYATTDAHVGRSLDVYGQWAEPELELCGLFLREGDVALDVGSNVGTHTVAFGQKVGPRGAVIAFEPQRFMHQLTCTNASLHGLTCVRAVLGAVGAAPGSVVVPDIDYSANGHFGGLSLGTWQQGDEVSVFTLDGLGLPRCALVKIDVEGMEGAVLDGAHVLLTVCKPVVYLEHNRPDGAPEVIERLLRHDYACFWHFSPFFDPKNFAGEPSDVFGGLVDANVLAVPRARASGLDTVLQPLTGPDDTANRALARR